MSESDDSSFSKMDVKDIKNCRACSLSGGIFEAGNVSINEVGYGNLTFQEMFERSIGYQIMPNEPQYFCQNCAQNLIQWYEFREVCNETQIFFSKSSYKIYNETIWFDADAQKSQINVKLEDDTDIKVNNYSVSSAAALNDYDLTKTMTFKVCLKNYPLSHGTSIGHITVKWTNQSEFYKQIWDSVKGQLRRKIIFVDNGLRPVWHENVPSESDLNDFVQVGDPIGKKSFSLNTICETSKKHLKKWETNYPSLYIYPYSNNVSSKPLWSIAEAALLKNDQSMAEELIKIEFEKLKLLQSINDLKVNKLSKQRKTPKPQKLVAPPEVLEIKDCSMPENTSNYKYAIIFEAFNRKFKTQELKNRFIGNFTIGANHLAEFKHNLWKILTPIIDREIVFDLNETPMWSTKEHPTVDEIEKFVEFSDRRGKRRYELKHITEMVLETWNDTKDNIISMNIYPYASNISTKASWLKAKKLFDPPAVDSENMEPQSQSVNEPSFDLDISSLVNKLKKVHKHLFPLATDRAWKMWAHYINSYAEIFHERLLNEKPPTQLLPFFEKNLEIVANPWWTKSCPPLISFSAFIRLKEGVKLQQSFLLGECEFMGDTIEEIKHSIWEKVRPYLFREIIFEDGIPKWSSKVTPTEEDLDKFVYINIIGERKIMKLDCFLKSFLEEFS
uniref:CSON009852 protein n=1 Tax=Culicoides sonorensis TaxID=179676 RepID=A0A336KGS9_CULSO